MIFRIKPYLALFILFFWMGICSAQQSNELIKVITYNIRLDHSGDEEDNWKHRKKDMVKFIKSERPDFFGIQEALFNQVSYLDNALGNYLYVGVGRDDGKKEGEFMAIFYNTKNWTVQQNSTFWLSPTPTEPSKGWDAACYRVCTYGIFKNREGQEIALFNTHFDHVGKIARSKSVEVIASYIQPYLELYPTILTGDFNVVPTDHVYTALKYFMTDSRSAARVNRERTEGTFNAFKREAVYDRRIDYIFINRSGFLTRRYEVKMPKTKKGRHLSDHFPVLVELKFSKK